MILTMLPSALQLSTVPVTQRGSRGLTMALAPFTWSPKFFLKNPAHQSHRITCGAPNTPGTCHASAHPSFPPCVFTKLYLSKPSSQGTFA